MLQNGFLLQFLPFLESLLLEMCSHVNFMLIELAATLLLSAHLQVALRNLAIIQSFVIDSCP